MAAQSPSEMARAAQRDIAVLRTEFEAFVQDAETAEVRRLRERFAVVESQVAKLERRATKRINCVQRWQC